MEDRLSFGILLTLVSIFRAVVGALSALVTEVDTVNARSRKACFNTQQ